MTIDIDDRQSDVSIDVDELALLYERCLERLKLPDAELSVALVDEPEMEQLNRERMGGEGPTDVLAFPQNEFHPEQLAAELQRERARLPAGAELAIGDIVLCPAVILAQAPADPWTPVEAPEDEASALVGRCPDPPGPESHFHLVAVHGLLHLLGHDHATLDQARAMADEQGHLLEATFEFTLLSEDEDEESEEADDGDRDGNEGSEEADDGDRDEDAARDDDSGLDEDEDELDEDEDELDEDEDELDEDGEDDFDEDEDFDEGEEDEERAVGAELPAFRPGFHAGYVALIGRPNVGKSTLMNALVGEKVSITSPKPQTTRNRILGISTDERAQILFIDTPGVHQARDAFNRRLVSAALESLQDADLVCYMIEPAGSIGPQEEFILEVLGTLQKPIFLLINKVDTVAKEKLLPLIESMSKRGRWEEVFPISALDGTNLAPLMDTIVARLPEGPAMYPADQLTDQTERFIVAETVREKVLEFARQEVPYATAVVVDRWEEKPGLLKIGADIHVERQNQKGILIGRGGAMLKRIGMAARRDLERFFDCRIYLELHVVVSERWRESESFLRSQNL